MKLLSLFSGGGLGDFGFMAAGMDIVGQVEIEDYCQEILALRYPESIKWKDIKNVSGKEIKEKIGGIDIITGGFPCFVGKTLISTSNGFKRIDSISNKDRVLTHNRRYKPVKNIMHRETKQIYQIRAQGMFEPMETTSEHPILIRRVNKKWNNSKRNYDKHIPLPEFIEAKDIKRGDYCGYPIDIPNSLDEKTEDFWYLIGRYLGDGWTNTSKRTSKIIGKRGSRVNSYNHKVYICASLDDATSLRLAIERAGYHVTVDKCKSIIKFIICDKKLCDFLLQFGKYAYGKYLPQFVFSLSREKQIALFNGWFDADGSEDKNGISVTTVSETLARGMARIARNAFRVPVSLRKTIRPKTCVIEGRTVNQRDSYRVRLVKNKDRYGFYQDGYIWCLIKSINIVSKTETVYNLEVSEDNSYVAEGIAVHNCQPFSVAGKQKGKEDSRYLWPEMLRLINECQPRWVIGENVPGITGVFQYTVQSPMEGKVYSTKEEAEADLSGETEREGENILHLVVGDLEEIGYEVYPIIFPAHSLGAWHKRDRVWIIAYRDNDKQEQQECDNKEGRLSSESRKRPRTRTSSGAEGGDTPKRSPQFGRSPSLLQAIMATSLGNSRLFGQKEYEEQAARTEQSSKNVGNPKYNGQSSTKEQGSSKERSGNIKEGEKQASKPKGSGEQYASVEDSRCQLQQGGVKQGADGLEAKEQDANFSERSSETYVANSDNAGSRASRCEDIGEREKDFGEGNNPQPKSSRHGEDDSNSYEQGLQGRYSKLLQECTDEWPTWEGDTHATNTAGIHAQRFYCGPWERKPWGGGWWESEPDVGRVANGIADRVHRLKMLGNGQVPACTYVLGSIVMEIEEALRIN